jgi:tetratricopeptide (TPR) repeat protein
MLYRVSQLKNPWIFGKQRNTFTGHADEVMMSARLSQIGANASLLQQAVEQYRRGNASEAERLCRAVLAENYGQASALHLLGLSLFRQQKLPAAIEAIQKAIALAPTNADFHGDLGRLLAHAKDVPGSIREFSQALILKPNHAEAHSNFGVALRDLGRLRDAEEQFRIAIKLDPGNWRFHCNLGGALREQNRLDESEAASRQAVALNPKASAALCNLATVLQDRLKYVQAKELFEQALAIDPANPDTHRNYHLLQLQMGNWDQGWEMFLPTWKFREGRTFDRPFWRGGDPQGLRLLVYFDRGLGDAIQFIRYAKVLAQKGAHVIVETTPALCRLFTRVEGIHQVVSKGTALPEYDFQMPILMLPKLVDPNFSAIPREVPYLSADQGLMERWSGILAKEKLCKVGIAWSASKPTPGPGDRCIPLQAFEPLAKVPGVRLYSLQKGPGSEQAKTIGKKLGVFEFEPELDEESGPFMDTAAVIKNLDLVVSTDTSIAHLAGALGVPIWVALSYSPEWRWWMARDASPWYPTMRLFRQPQPGNWSDLFIAMASELRGRIR